MELDFPADFIAKQYAHPEAGFNICHFKDIRHASDAPAHFRVVISLKNGTSLVLCIITTQMVKLERMYSGTNDKALDSLVPLDNSIFQCITRPCVINCNNAELLTHQELTLRIDPRTGIKTRETDNKFENELKEKILIAVHQSPIVKDYIKSALSDTFPEFFAS
jgi:hypothetical protein